MMMLRWSWVAAAASVLSFFLPAFAAAGPADRPAAESRPGPGADGEAFSFGGDGFAMFGPSGDRAPLRYHLSWAPERPVRGQNADFGFTAHELGASRKVWEEGPGSLRLFATLRADLLDTDLILPDSGRPLPDTLWSARVGAGYVRRLQRGWVAGGNLSIGSAGDRPFSQFRDVDAGLLAFLHLPRDEGEGWNFALVYRPFSEFPYPLPAVSYSWRPSPDFRMNLGIPFQVMYRPADALTLNFSYMPLLTVRAQAVYRLPGSWRLFAAYDWGSRVWYLHDREDDDERLHLVVQNLAAGVRTDLTDQIGLELSAGYQFDRFFYAGDDYSDRDNDRVRIDDGPLFSVRTAVRW